MDDLERKRIVEKMKRKADIHLEAKRSKEADKLRMLAFGLDARKAMAMTSHAMRQLENPRLKNIRNMDNRPAEKLVLNRTKGMKKGGKALGRKGPGV